MNEWIAGMLYRIADRIHARKRDKEMPVVAATTGNGFAVLVRERCDGGLVVDFELFVVETNGWIATGHIPGEKIRTAVSLLSDTLLCLDNFKPGAKELGAVKP